ncbi:unnamed protein product [Larinioides sclopetarius]|uniref:Uncharacterized protein n=1 Tax=Larinioides sclopetarius TaxID=280406 RepID=A0AAV2A082_9ARAC
MLKRQLLIIFKNSNYFYFLCKRRRENYCNRQKRSQLSKFDEFPLLYLPEYEKHYF